MDFTKIYKVILLFVLLSNSALTFADGKPPVISTSHLYENFYVYTSYGKPDEGEDLFPANGLYVVTNDGIVLIDTPWDEAQTIQLADTLEKKHHQKIALCVVTHHHSDRTAGLEWLKKHGAKTYSSLLTQSLTSGSDEKQAAYTFESDTTITFGNVKLETFYPGAGHSLDNLVVWFPDSKVLFGGCLVRSFDSKAIPDTPGSNTEQWTHAARKLFTKYGDAAFVIPGHEGWEGGTAMLSHTMIILSKSRGR
ncbi:subclass B1 metallo-beta-lactamase [uncultured Mucilaginibacter sp.]|uniref:subclass B1 metallo-beta-lactamase n=1 Tax=uncultured Mucilaginibacter sp. TaxID=797541 RepID=UPI0025EEFBFD|nr:subclass B1 metallo-beta-lactamase [uncultured Mucilaginibacter sp.]